MPISKKALLFALPVLPLVFLAASQGPDRPQGGEKRARPQGMGQMPDLVGALKKTEGCLGVETGRMQSGKQVIFAWFENKAAVVRWYRGRTHRSVMRSFTDMSNLRKPLSLVKDGTGPIMVIASLTMAKKPKFASMKLPVSQIAIELYQPLPGGAFLGERFTPKNVPVEGSRDLIEGDKAGAAEASGKKDG